MLRLRIYASTFLSLALVPVLFVIIEGIREHSLFGEFAKKLQRHIQKIRGKLKGKVKGKLKPKRQAG